MRLFWHHSPIEFLAVLLLGGGTALYVVSEIFGERLWGEGLTKRDAQILQARGIERSGRVTAVGVRHSGQPMVRIRFSTLEGDVSFISDSVYEAGDVVPVVFDPEDPGRVSTAAELAGAADMNLPRFKGNPYIAKLLGAAAVFVGLFVMVSNI